MYEILENYLLYHSLYIQELIVMAFAMTISKSQGLKEVVIYLFVGRSFLMVNYM